MRTADRWIGTPTLIALGAARRLRGRLPSSGLPPSIGLLKTAAIGDTVLMSGVIADLRRAAPEADITLFAGPSNIAVAPLLPGLTRTVAINPTDPLGSLRAIRSIAPHTLIDFGSWPRIDAILASAGHAQRTIGFRTPGQHRHFAFDQVVDHLQQHEIDNYRALVAPLGVESRSAPTLVVPEHAVLPPELGLREAGERYVVFHTCSGGVRRELKEWPVEYWITLGRHALSQLPGQRILFTGSEADREVIRQIVPELPGSLDLSGLLTLGQTARLLSGATATVSVNTGIAHVAAALHVPTVVLDGATSAQRWGPVGARVASVAAPPPAGGYLHLGWETPDPSKGQSDQAMRLIAPDAVCQAVCGLLSDRRPRIE